MEEKIQITIPDWANDKPITIMAGREPFLLYLPHTNKWYRKIQRCNMCGKCCTNVSKNFPFRNEEGNCRFLKREVRNFPPYNGKEVFVCTNYYVPIICGILRNPLVKPHPECAVEYQEVE